jgi:hypothetical protein
LDTGRRRALLDQLSKELGGTATPDGPAIFEIPFEQADKIDVLVVWREWENVRSDDRTNVILDAYKDQREKVSQALGVTYDEAMDQQLLPYSIDAGVRFHENEVKATLHVTDDDLNRHMREEGGFPLPDGTTALRYPTLGMAEEACQRLQKKFPRGCWYVGQSGRP